MACLGHTVTLTWRDLSSNFKIDISRIKNIGEVGATPKLLSLDIKKMVKETPGIISDGIF